jgi:hypothetical protein
LLFSLTHLIRHFGVATHFVTSDRLPELEKKLIDMPTYSEDAVKTIIESFSSKPPSIQPLPPPPPSSPLPSIFSFIKNYHLFAESSTVATQWQQIQEIFSLNSVEAIFRALEKDNSEWASTTLNKMKTCSPTSLKVFCFLFFIFYFYFFKILYKKIIFYIYYNFLCLTGNVQTNHYWKGIRRVADI